MQFDRNMGGYLEWNMNGAVLNYEMCYSRVRVASMHSSVNLMFQLADQISNIKL